MKDPFAGLADAAPASPERALADLLASTKRGYVPLRKSLVQWPSDQAVRPNQLARFVTGRQERALDALLLLHALTPILDGSPLALATWARLLSVTAPCGPKGASAAFDTLVTMGLATRGAAGSRPVVTPLREDGSGATWVRPGSPGDNVDKGYFVLPHDYWTSGLSSRLNMPGKAMLLIMLAETSDKPNFAMAAQRAKDWYGVSERTAERGYGELSAAGLLLVHVQTVAAPKHPLGFAKVYHRALADPYSMDSRARLQRSTRTQARRASPRTGGIKSRKPPGNAAASA